MHKHFQTYFAELKKIGTSKTEHAYRTPFENVLNAIKKDTSIQIIHEPKRKKGFGAPDFRIEIDGALLGYIETKKIGEDLGKIIESEQIARYLSLCNNLILTNYHQFKLIKITGEGRNIETCDLFYPVDLESTKSKLKEGETLITKHGKPYSIVNKNSPLLLAGGLGKANIIDYTQYSQALSKGTTTLVKAI